MMETHPYNINNDNINIFYIKNQKKKRITHIRNDENMN